MKLRSIPAFVVAAGLAAGAVGQVIVTPGVSATFSMNWVEEPVFAHNDNGVLETGEHALIRTSFSFTNQYQWVDFTPAIGSFSRGIVVGMSSAFFEIRTASPNSAGLYNNGVTVPTSTSIGPDADAAGATGYGIRSLFRVAGDTSNGTLQANGFINIQPGQFVHAPAAINQTNPITNMDRLGWAPNSYAQRTVNFAISAPAAEGGLVNLYLDLDGTTDGAQSGYVPGSTYASAYLPLSGISFASVNIPVAPAPASIALLGPGGLIVGRRKRVARRAEISR